jgi:hypothetical protein
MGDFIDDKVIALSEEDREKVRTHLMAILESDTELEHRGFDPHSYSPRMVLLTAYQEVIEHDSSRLREYWLNK